VRFATETRDSLKFESHKKSISFLSFYQIKSANISLTQEIILHILKNTLIPQHSNEEGSAPENV
jgi:hypothetical protein